MPGPLDSKPMPETSVKPDHVDVLIVGAGLSGIGAAHELRRELPGKTFAILEARGSSGGTWDLFKYPGFRCDTDMQTLGYRTRPWTEDLAVADGPSVLNYIRETAREDGTDPHIRFNHKVTDATWSSETATWTVEATDDEGNAQPPVTCSFFYMCSGYYRYDEGFSPDFKDSDKFEGPIIHPQKWPEDLDYSGKKVVIIGSGATAVTLVPAMAETAGHVTMLQRSPSYVLTVPLRDKFANRMRGLVGNRLSYMLTRWKNIANTIFIYQFSQKSPRLAKRLIRHLTASQLPEGYDVDVHFKPSYDPWDQRLCLVPDGDLFKSISEGKASIVTDRIERFTKNGVKLESGAELDGDIFITATGFILHPFGGIQLNVDGKEIKLPDTFAYKGMMLSGIPNFVFTIGYTNAPWTLKADLVAGYTCRLLEFMDERGVDKVVPVNDDPSVTRMPILDFASGYVQRSIEHFPTAGSRDPWGLSMNYLKDLVTLRHRPISDPALRFSKVPDTGAKAPSAATAGKT